MTTTHTTTPWRAASSGGGVRSPGRGGLSARSRVEYDRDWALFDDWCAAVDLQSLPADPGTVVRFVAACPAASATLARRVAAIDNAHAAVGIEQPGSSEMVRAALGRPPLDSAPTITTKQLHEALNLLPSHGWTTGLFGRRDRALLVLTAAGVEPVQLAAATIGDLHVEGAGVATFVNGGNVMTFHRCNDDPAVCGPCVLARWVRLLRMIAITHSHRRWIDALQNSPSVTPQSRHQCINPVQLCESTRRVPLLPRIDQWGYLDTTLTPVGPRSLTLLSRAALQLRPVRHRLDLLPAKPEPAAHPPAPTTPPVRSSRVYGQEQWREGLRRRSVQRQRAADIDVLLHDIERRAADLLDQSRDLLAR